MGVGGALEFRSLGVFGPKDFNCKVYLSYGKILNELKAEGVISHHKLHYCGRRPSSSTATGSLKVHNE